MNLSDQTKTKYIQRLTFEGYDEPAVRWALEELEKKENPPAQPMPYLRKMLSSRKPDSEARPYRVVIVDTSQWSKEDKLMHSCPDCGFIGPHGTRCKYRDDDAAATVRRRTANPEWEVRS